MPHEGESVQQLSEKSAVSLLPPAIRPVPFKNADGSEDVNLYIDPAAFHDAVAGDVDPDTTDVMAAAQWPPAGTALGTPSGSPA